VRGASLPAAAAQAFGPTAGQQCAQPRGQPATGAAGATDRRAGPLRLRTSESARFGV